MRVRAKVDGLAEALRSGSARVFSVVDDEVADGADGLKADLRQQTADALGIRVANAWRGKFYPNKGDPKGPAGFVWSKAPRIIDFFSSSKIVTPIGHAFAIPTENVPRGARGRRLSPIEVEARFNAELQPVRLKGGGLGLMIEVGGSRGRGGRGKRAGTKLLMFVLERHLRSRQLIDLEATGQRWGARIATNIDRRLGVGE